jgi:hypothetical protein
MILSAPDLVTPERLTAILRAKGAIREARVTGLRHEPIGIGLFGDTVRFTIDYDRAEPGAPATIAGKFPTVDEAVRANGAAMGMYRIEVNFYREIAADVAIRRPDCLYAEIDESGGEFGVLLEDMGPARAADQIAGCSRADAEHVFAQAAALHAPRFGDPRLPSIDWLNTRHPTYAAIAAGLADNYRVFRERYEHLVEPDHIAAGERFCAVAGRLVDRGPRQTIIHGDYRLDNMLFDAQRGAVPLVVLDWQSVGVANSGLDTAYFMATSYPIEQRGRDEGELLRFYHEAMQARGVRDYGWGALWEDYRRGSWVAMITAIAVSALSKQTERGDRMFVRMFRGAAAQMLDLGGLAVA